MIIADNCVSKQFLKFDESSLPTMILIFQNDTADQIDRRKAGLFEWKYFSIVLNDPFY